MDSIQMKIYHVARLRYYTYILGGGAVSYYKGE